METPTTAHPSRPSALSPEEAEALAATLVEEMIRRWRRGERPLPEEFLDRHPGLWEHPEAAADLIFEEIGLRQEFSPAAPAEQVLGRFPRWRPQLELLLECQRLLGPRPATARFPAVGETVGDFLLVSELGRGAQGRVFAARQQSLGGRPVVLKLMPGGAHEHLSQASLQHTHIVPLYSVEDHPDLGIRALCMPYFGGATLAQLLEAMSGRPPGRRSGRDLLGALDRVHSAIVPIEPTRGRSRSWLGRASYAEAVVGIGADLADALQHAHERGLLHLDLKPSNVLLTADGRAMLLDFHLARGPIDPEAPGPQRLGGTAGYMAPEQQEAVRAIERGRPVPRPVDARADIYALGVVLHEALGGKPPEPGVPFHPLDRANPQVSGGLADIVSKCLAADPAGRYPDMAALADDLRRHLAHRPLLGVRNRPRERWRKWRRRRPHGVAVTGMMLAVLAAAGAVALGAMVHVHQRIELVRSALEDGPRQIASGRWDEAVATLRLGQAAARDIPLERDLADALAHWLHRAEQGRDAAGRAAAARHLHALADRVRFLSGADRVPTGDLRGLEAPCRAFWQDRGRVVDRLRPAGASELDPTVREDLLDLALFWADLQGRMAPAPESEAARGQALTILDQAEALLGPSPVLDRERIARGAPGRAPEAPARTAWEHVALGRALLRAGELARAAAELDEAARLQPQGLWPNFYQGLCAYRLGRYEDAIAAFSVCIGAAPEAAGCFYNRARAFDAAGLAGPALRDYDQALRLDPGLAAALLNRGVLHARAGRPDMARADLLRARDLGVDPATVGLDLALVDLALGQRDAALADLRRVLADDPENPDARRLYDRLAKPGPGTR